MLNSKFKNSKEAQKMKPEDLYEEPKNVVMQSGSNDIEVGKDETQEIALIHQETKSNNSTPSMVHSKQVPSAPVQTTSKIDHLKDNLKTFFSSTIGKITFILIIAVCVICAIVGSALYKTYKQTYRPVLRIGNYDVSQLEYDAYYRMVYMQAYAKNFESGKSKLFDINSSKFLNSTQSLETGKTWKQYLQEQTVTAIAEKNILKSEALKNNYLTDTDKNWAKFLNTAKTKAQKSKLSLSDFLINEYGPNATKSNLKPIIEDYFYASAYSSHKFNVLIPSSDKIEDYYEQNKDYFDVVDYGDAILNDENTAKELYNQTYNAKSFIATSQKYTKNVSISYAVPKTNVPDTIASWLFTSGQKDNSTAIIKDDATGKYHVVYLIKRYRNEDPSVDYQSIVIAKSSNNKNVANKLLLQLQKDNDEQTFVQYTNQYSQSFSLDSNNGYINKTVSTNNKAIDNWLFDPSRKEGDIELFETPNTYEIVRFRKEDIPKWQIQVKQTIADAAYQAYLHMSPVQITKRYQSLAITSNYISFDTPSILVFGNHII